MFEISSFSIFEKNLLESDYYENEMIEDRSPVTYDKYPQKSDYDDMIENNSPLTFDEYPQERD